MCVCFDTVFSILEKKRQELETACGWTAKSYVANLKAVIKLPTGAGS